MGERRVSVFVFEELHRLHPTARSRRVRLLHSEPQLIPGLGSLRSRSGASSLLATSRDVWLHALFAMRTSFSTVRSRVRPAAHSDAREYDPSSSPMRGVARGASRSGHQLTSRTSCHPRPTIER